MQLKYIIKENDLYKNINQVLKEKFHVSSRLFSTLIKENSIYLNGKTTDTRNQVKKDDCISISFDYEEDNSNILPAKMDLNIIYEDEAYLVIDKPPHIAIHPSMRHYGNSLSNGIKYYFDEIGLKKKIRPINRLDINTSGLCIFAKNEYVQQSLIDQMNKNQFQKKYICLVNGILKEKQGTISLPIARKGNSIIERCVSEAGQSAITHYIVLKEEKNFSLVECSLETGRTHQIRVHFSSIGHPILGDTLYGSASNLIDRQALHSSKISFFHPVTHQEVCYTSPLPKDIRNIVGN